MELFQEIIHLNIFVCTQIIQARYNVINSSVLKVQVEIFWNFGQGQASCLPLFETLCQAKLINLALHTGMSVESIFSFNSQNKSTSLILKLSCTWIDCKLIVTAS